MSGDKDKTGDNDLPDGKTTGGLDLSSYLKDMTPTMARILKEEEERTAAMAAGNGAGDEPDLEFADTGDEDASETNPAEDDPFMIMEEESFDISFDNLGDSATEEDSNGFEEVLDDFDLDEEEADDAPVLAAESGHAISLDGDDAEEDEDDLGPPLPDLSALTAEDDEDDVDSDIGDLPDIEFADDDDEGDGNDDAPETQPASAAETPAGAEPLDLEELTEGLEISFDDDAEPTAREGDETPPETDETDAEEPALAADDLADIDSMAPAEVVEAAAPAETDLASEDESIDIEMVDADEDDAAETESDIPDPADEFAGWGDEGDGKTEDEDEGEDLGPPLPDLSAPGDDGEDDAEAAVDADLTVLAAELEGETESEPESERGEGVGEGDEELTLEIEGLEFKPGDTIDESADIIEAGAADTGKLPTAKSALDIPLSGEGEPDDDTDDPSEAAPGVAEAAKPVSVQEALLAAIELHRVGDLEGAAHGYEMLVRRYPNSAAGWINLGIVLRRLGKLDAALVCLRRGVMLNPKDGAAWSNLGNALRAANYLEDAKRSQIKAISLAPGAAQIHYNMGLVTRDFGELADADSCFRRAELLGYANPDLPWDRSLNLLLSGNLEEGFAAYEARWDLPDTAKRYADLPRWQGDMQKDKTVVIHAEQGLGDSLQFCRYVPTLKSRVGRLIFEVQPQLVDLLNASSWFRGVEIHAREQASVAADMQMPLLSTPILLPLGESVLPGRDPYLTPPPNGPRIREGLPGPRIGIAWAGKPTHKNDANRSAGLSTFTALFDVLNVRYYSLQVGPAQAQIRNLALNSVIQDLSPAIRSFADTASLLQDIDLVVTVDTSVAHLAGAMGKQVWVVLPFSPDWRWQLRRQDSPWYPSMRLFRQSSPGDWDGVFMRVRNALDEWLDARKEKPKA